MRHGNGRDGFTLIELLIVVAIIGVLAAIAIPNLMLAMQRSRQKRTMADMRLIAVRWEARHVDTSGYVPSGQATAVDLGDTAVVTWETLASMLSPTYLRDVPRRDGWGHPFEFRADNDEYYIRSAGMDGVFEAPPYQTTHTKFYECDIVYGNGIFLVVPDGSQISMK